MGLHPDARRRRGRADPQDHRPRLYRHRYRRPHQDLSHRLAPQPRLPLRRHRAARALARRSRRLGCRRADWPTARSPSSWVVRRSHARHRHHRLSPRQHRPDGDRRARLPSSGRRAGGASRRRSARRRRRLPRGCAPRAPPRPRAGSAATAPGSSTRWARRPISPARSMTSASAGSRTSSRRAMPCSWPSSAGTIDTPIAMGDEQGGGLLPPGPDPGRGRRCRAHRPHLHGRHHRRAADRRGMPARGGALRAAYVRPCP